MVHTMADWIAMQGRAAEREEQAHPLFAGCRVVSWIDATGPQVQLQQAVRCMGQGQVGLGPLQGLQLQGSGEVWAARRGGQVGGGSRQRGGRRAATGGSGGSSSRRGSSGTAGAPALWRPWPQVR